MKPAESATIPQIQIVNSTGLEYYYYAYDGKTKGPAWVLEVIGPVNSSDKSENVKIQVDTTIPSTFRNDQADFLNSGFDMGVLLNASNLTASLCPISTISPQLPEFNRIYWPKIEQYVKQLSIKLNKKVLVITGPLYLPHEESDGKRYVTYQVIGKNSVAVPTHFFKAIFYSVENSEDFSISSEAYIIPNQDINEGTLIESFRTSLENLEKTSGIIFPKDKDIKPYIKARSPMMRG
jgi:endonuclease G